MILRRLLLGDGRHRTRLHDFEGNRMPLAGLRDAIPSICTTILRKAGFPFRSPWWPYGATRYLNELIQGNWRVLEFGSGASTVWLARRARQVVSLESDPGWYSRVQAELCAAGLANVDLRLCQERDRYTTADGAGSEGYDLVIVDGAWRDSCAATALRLVRAGGYIYFDNSDVPDPDHRLAVQLLLRAGASGRRFIGLGPGVVAVSQGLLVQILGEGETARRFRG